MKVKDLKILLEAFDDDQEVYYYPLLDNPRLPVKDVMIGVYDDCMICGETNEECKQRFSLVSSK